MIKRILKKGIAHLSLAIIIMGAFCFLASNILLKEILDQESYGKYSVLITYLSITYMYGLLGLEQIFLRYSNHLADGVIETQKYQVYLCLSVICLMAFSWTVFFIFYFSDIGVNIFLLSLSTLSIIALLYLFNIFRLNTNFIFAQFISNFWKILLFAIAGVFYLVKLSDLVLLLDLIMGAVVLTSAFALYSHFRKIRFVYNEAISPKEIRANSFQFLVSITSFSLLMFADRFIIENKFGVREFGNYFYLTNFFLAPFSILQNYIGFKQLVHFKTKFSISDFDSFNKKILILGIVVSIILLMMTQLLVGTGLVNFNFTEYTAVILLLLIMGVVRLYSASINSAFEAKTDLGSLQMANVLFIILSAIIILIAIVLCSTLELIILTLILLWLIRSIVLKRLLLRQIKRDLKG